MTDFLNRLRAYLDAPATMQLAQAAPLGILAGASAAVIAAVIGMPAFATSGLGLIFGGLAVNFTSSLIDEIVHAGGERERTRLIEQGLAASDPDGDRARHGEAGDPTVNGGPPGADPVRHPGDAGGGAGV